MKVYFSLCLLLSSSLLMLVQPMVARMLLPHLGGSPSVWNTCMVFFQAGLLAGYAYAHLGPRWLGMRRHAALHGVLLLAALAFLPIALHAPDAPPTWPSLWMLTTLTLGVAIPYVLLASTSSLVQAWFAKSTNEDPYFLYAASNFGSFLGLFAYPFIFEPTLALSGQSQWWHGAFVALVALLWVAIAIVLMRSAGTAESKSATPSQRPPRARVIRWVLLALAPSSLMLSVTNHLTTDLASIPLLWIIPLALYLLTFVVVFSRRPIISHSIVVRYVPIVIFFLIFLWFSEATAPLVLIVLMHLIGFTWLTLFCHGELAGSRPPADQLTSFYFWLALGGVLGGACNVIVAPLLFPSYLEYPLMLVVIGALRPMQSLTTPATGFERLKALLTFPAVVGGIALALVLFGRFLHVQPGKPFLAVLVVPLMATLMAPRASSYALALLAIIATASVYPSIHGDILERRRSFFGVHRVAQHDDPIKRIKLIKLIHGNTIHGLQSPLNPREPLAYYHKGSPIAAVIKSMSANDQLKSVGVVGLGSGALAAYAQKGQDWTFFEIDSDVETLARRHFTYLTDCRASVRIVLGDARLTLAQSGGKFDLLVIDAFGSDSIPTHLLTQEALAIYAAHLNDGGVIAFHVSNLYLDLFPVLAALATPDWHAYGSDPAAWPVTDEDEKTGYLSSWWTILTKSRDLCPPPRWTPLSPPPNLRPWSDDFINLLPAVRLRDLWSND